MFSRFYFLLFLLFSVLLINAQTPNTSVLQLEEIMKGADFVGYSPRSPFWSLNSDTLYFEWRQQTDKEYHWYWLSPNDKNAKPQLLAPEKWHTIPAAEGHYNKDRSLKVYEKFGNIYIADIKKKSLSAITATAAYEYNPVFSGDEKKVFYQSDNDLFAWDIATGTVQQYTYFLKGNAPGSARYSAIEQYYITQEKKLFPHLINELESDWDKKSRPKTPKAIYLQDNNVGNVKISPTEQYISFRLSKYNSGLSTEVPEFITESGYVKNFKARAKTGTTNLQNSQMGIYDRLRDTVYFINNNQIPDIFRKPSFLREYASKKEEYDSLYISPREVVFHGIYYSNKNHAALEIKALDNKDRWIMLVDLPTGKLSLIDQQHNDAWIGGPGIENWDDAPGTMGWLPDGETLYFQSEADGYSHLYTYHQPTGKVRQITKGKFEVHEVLVSKDGMSFYLTTSQTDAGEKQLYKYAVSGEGEAQRISSQNGQYEAFISPDEKNIAFLYSYSNRPWDLYLQANRPNADLRQITDSRSEAFKAYAWRDPQIVYFKAEDGAMVRARLYQAQADKKSGAAVIFVHGAGYLQNAHKGWSYYQREFMFHNLLADNGYTVLDIDYRGSAGYGADWRTGIYRNMGGKDLSDQVDGVAYLVREQGVDAARIGIYGGSYGGFISLMAMFKSAGTFRCAAAMRSVTDWAHYNQPYTRDILNLPLEDSIAYQRSSPIYHAEGLKGRLLMLHGMIDDNVQFQDIIRLNQRLIDLRKENWELAVYPIERHGFVETNGWLDEYRRIFKLFQEELK